MRSKSSKKRRYRAYALILVVNLILGVSIAISSVANAKIAVATDGDVAPKSKLLQSNRPKALSAGKQNEPASRQGSEEEESASTQTRQELKPQSTSPVDPLNPRNFTRIYDWTATS